MFVDSTIQIGKPIKDMSPVEFEIFCKDVLQKYAEEEEGLKDFCITHDVVIPSHDGNYQIDIYATFIAFGVKIKILCECKKYTQRVNRDIVAVLNDKVKSLGAHKAIIFSTSEYQSGAIKYAEEHGVALIVLSDDGEHFVLQAPRRNRYHR